MCSDNSLTSYFPTLQSSKKEKKSKKKDKTEKDDAADGAGDEPKEPKRAQRATSNVFALFNQAQIQEFKEVGFRRASFSFEYGMTGAKSDGYLILI